MPETPELRPLVEAAEQAAAAGDYASAERSLREAARLQEASLGPLHPDLANTLNNLGVVCDLADRPDEAEICYRRAYAIAAAALTPDHPFVATSRTNLEDFCRARGKPVELPSPPRAPEPVAEPRATSSIQVAREPSWRSKSRALVIGGVAAGAVVMAIFLTLRPRSSSSGLAESSTPTTESLSESPAPVPVEPIPSAKPTTSDRPEPAGVGQADPISDATATTSTAQKVQRSAAVPSTDRAAATSTLASPLVANALLCSALSTSPSRGSAVDWHCDRASSPVGAGSLVFYTRVKSERDTTVQHRWYRGDRLQQAVELSIRANPGGGYRTYSRYAVDNQDAGDWRVELRTKDGSLLHEERFTVQ